LASNLGKLGKPPDFDFGARTCDFLGLFRLWRVLTLPRERQSRIGNWSTSVFGKQEFCRYNSERQIEDRLHVDRSEQTQLKRRGRSGNPGRRKKLFAQNPDWVTFFREVLGLGGIVRRMCADSIQRCPSRPYT